MWVSFLEVYNGVVDECVPTYKEKMHITRPKWMTERLLEIIQEKENAWQSYQDRRTSDRRETYIAARNRATAETWYGKFN